MNAQKRADQIWKELKQELKKRKEEKHAADAEAGAKRDKVSIYKCSLLA